MPPTVEVRFLKQARGLRELEQFFLAFLTLIKSTIPHPAVHHHWKRISPNEHHDQTKFTTPNNSTDQTTTAQRMKRQ